MRALLLQVFYSIRSERQLCEQLRYNLLFRWFVGLALDDPIWDHSTFSKNRDRLLAHQVVEGFFAEVLRLADSRGLLSAEHFSVEWHADSGVGEPEELSAEGRERRTSAPVAAGAMRKRTGRGSRGATRPTPAPRIRTPGSIARAITRRRFSATKVMR